MTTGHLKWTNVVYPGGSAVIEQDVSVVVPHDTLTEICELEGTGTMMGAAIAMITSVVPTPGAAPAAVVYELQLYVDGVFAWATNNRDITQSSIATSGRAPDGTFYQGSAVGPVWDRTQFYTIVELKFKKKITLYAYQSTGGAVTTGGLISANVII